MQNLKNILIIMALCAFVLLTGCTATKSTPPMTGSQTDGIEQGREYWKQAEFDKAEKVAKAQLDTDAGKHLLFDIYAVKGEYQAAADLFSKISSDYSEYRKALTSAAFLHAVHLKDIPKAKSLAAQLKSIAPEMDRKENTIWVFINALEKPMEVTTKGTFVVPMDTTHQYNPYMPVVAGSVNGHKKPILFDTGGSTLMITQKTARELGIEFDENHSFVGAQGHSESKMWVGVVKSLKLGEELELVNVPTVVLEKINVNQELIIFGTTICKEFLTTIDGPNNQFIFTTRDNKELVEKHRIMYQGSKMDFTMYADHFMMGKGKYNGHDINMFWDSGLVVVGAVDGQAAQAWLNITKKSMENLGIEERDETSPTVVTPTNDTLEFAGLENENALICLKPGEEREFGGVHADALVGYGIQKKYAWTIDFDNMEYMFAKTALQREEVAPEI